MKIMILGRNTETIHDQARSAGLQVVDQNPEVIVTYGGDGTFIGSERQYPGIPKLGIRRRDTSIKCERHQDLEVLHRLKSRELVLDELLKLEGRNGDRTLLAVNDVILRNSDPRTAVRFRVSLNGHPVTEELIADGLVACTPFGSSAYFRSITRTMIRTGIGVAYNNCTDLLNHLVIGEDESLEVQLTRGPASMVADNDPELIELGDADKITIRRAPDPFRVLAVDTLRCADCRYVHAPRRRY